MEEGEGRGGDGLTRRMFPGRERPPPIPYWAPSLSSTPDPGSASDWACAESYRDSLPGGGGGKARDLHRSTEK